MCVQMHVYVRTENAYMCVCMFICACVPLCMQTCLCTCVCVCARAGTNARLLHLPMPHVAQPRRKTPILSDQKEKQTFWMKVLWSSVGPFIFLVIIIYSRHIDNAPTQTL